MKKSFMTRVLATGLSFAMAFSMAAATNVTTASAAAKEASVTSMMKVASKTVTEGKSVTTYMNSKALKTYRIKKVSLTDTAKKYIAVTLKSSRKGFTIKANADAVTNAKLEKKGVNVKIYFSKATTAAKAKKTAASKYANLKVVVKAAVAPVEEVAKITAATQKESKKVAVTFSKAVDAVKTADFTVTRVDGNVVIPVKAVTLDADKKAATIETYTDMKDGKEYTVAYTATDEAKTVSNANFVATDAKVAKLTASTATISANDSTEVKINTLDAQGVLLGTYKFSELAAQKITVDIKCSNNGYKDGDKIYLKNTGDTAEIKTVLHTYQYENGVEKDTIEETFIITAVDETYSGYTFGYSLVKVGAGEPAWAASSYKQNTATPVKEGASAYFNIKNAAGADRTSKFSVSSADTSVVLISEGTLVKGTPVSVTGVKEGSTYLLIKDEKKNLIASLPISVNAARKATRLELSVQSLSISNAASQAAIDVKPTVYDQYNEKMTIGSIDFTKLTVASGDAVLAKTDTATVKKFTVTGANMTKGHYYYELKATVNNVSVTNNLSVTISAPSGSVESYGVEVELATVDLATDETSTSSKGAVVQKIRVARYQGGVLKDYLSTASIASITVKGTNKEGDISAKVVSDGSVMSVTCGAISGAGIADPFAQLVKTGTYAVEVTINTSDKATAKFANTFTVKNEQADKYAANVKATDLSTKYGSLGTAFTDKDIFEITKDGAGIFGTYTIKQINSKKAGASDKVEYVESVEIDATVNGNNHIYVVVPVEKAFQLQ